VITLSGMIGAIGRMNSRVLLLWRPAPALAIAIEWKIADLWIGAYVYTRQPEGIAPEEINIYLIAVPTLVLRSC
jgi:hypothetical protein